MALLPSTEVIPTDEQLATGDHRNADGPAQQDQQEGDQKLSTPEQAAELLSKYWAANKDTAELWTVLGDKSREFHDALTRKGFYALYRMIYSMFFGMTPTTNEYDYSTHTVSFAGEDGEEVELNINEIRSFCDQVVTMVTGTRPAFQAVATNNDYQTMSQVMSSDAVVQYFYANAFNEMKERAVVDREVRYGKAFSHLQWDVDGGRTVKVKQPPISKPGIGDLPQPDVEQKTGNIRITAKYHWDVVCEPYKSEYEDHLWRLVSEDDIDKWEAMARFPLYADAISESSHPGDPYETHKPGWDPSAKLSSDACSVRVFYHARASALPNGRHVVFINNVAVYDDDLPIEEIPVYPLISCEMDRTCFGVSDIWNLIPAEQMMNAALSDMATNIDAFGRPPLALTEGTDIDLDSLANGQTLLFVPPNAQMPQAVKFPTIPDVTPHMIKMMREFKMSSVGSNAVARGDTSSEITSGAHAALYSQQAVQNQSPRQLGLDLFRERLANGCLKLLQRFGEHPQLVAIVGVDERPYMEEFKADQWNGIQRVTMKTVNPALRTVAGRMQVVEMLRDWPGQPLKDPQRIVDLIVTGQMKPLLDPMRVVELAARYENEMLLQGPPTQQIPGEPDPVTGVPSQDEVVQNVRALVTDNVATHIIAHLEVLYSPMARKNPAVRNAVMVHIQEHMRVARMSDPMLAQIVGNPPPETGMQPPDKGDDGSGPNQKDVKNAVNAAKSPTGEDDSKGAMLPKPAQPPTGA